MSAHKVRVWKEPAPVAYCETCAWSYRNPASITDVRQHAAWHRQERPQPKTGAAS